MTSTQILFQTHFPDLKTEYDFVLAPLTYFKIGGPAEVYVALNDKEQIARVVAFCHQHDLNLTIIGGASNVIIADEGIKGVVLHLSGEEVELTSEKSGDLAVIYADAGIKTALLVSKVITLGYQGLEYFLGVPGTLGGAIYNNSHYLADLIGKHVLAVEVINPDGQRFWLSHDECDFAYDHSRFHTTKEVIVGVKFALEAGQKEESQAKVREATLYRAQTQPLGIPNSGCIFQNTPNNDQLRQLFPQFAERSHVPGGFLIDQAGLKGTREGDVEVSDKHAAFIINRGHGTARDVKTLIQKVKQRVKEKFGVELTEEVFYL